MRPADDALEVGGCGGFTDAGGPRAGTVPASAAAGARPTPKDASGSLGLKRKPVASSGTSSATRTAETGAGISCATVAVFSSGCSAACATSRPTRHKMPPVSPMMPDLPMGGRWKRKVLPGVVAADCCLVAGRVGLSWP